MQLWELSKTVLDLWTTVRLGMHERSKTVPLNEGETICDKLEWNVRFSGGKSTTGCSFLSLASLHVHASCAGNWRKVITDQLHPFTQWSLLAYSRAPLDEINAPFPLHALLGVDLEEIIKWNTKLSPSGIQFVEVRVWDSPVKLSVSFTHPPKWIRGQGHKADEDDSADDEDDDAEENDVFKLKAAEEQRWRNGSIKSGTYFTTVNKPTSGYKNIWREHIKLP